MVSIAVWTLDAGAFVDVGNCVVCHTDFAGGSTSNAHQGHLGMGLPQSCNTCHVNIGDTPITSKCAECHIEPGLPLHHIGAGAGTCGDCHPFNPPGAENDPVPGYAGLSVPLAPCDRSEERFSSFTVSLDNDGDGLYDQDDPDCQPPVETNCADGLDNDNDSVTDCSDQDCVNDPVCQLVCAPTGVPESICNGVDDDCDGTIDEDFSSQSITCGVGECASAGQTTCVGGIDGDTCIPGTPVVEGPRKAPTCSDGIDNDCDGFTDMDDSNCVSQKVAICHKGKKTITISSNAIPAHLAHGDTTGSCADKHNKKDKYKKKD